VLCHRRNCAALSDQCPRASRDAEIKGLQGGRNLSGGTLADRDQPDLPGQLALEIVPNGHSARAGTPELRNYESLPNRASGFRYAQDWSFATPLRVNRPEDAGDQQVVWRTSVVAKQVAQMRSGCGGQSRGNRDAAGER
jgi:hypothetical protein